MKERPIIFHESLIESLLDGRKTQTRRVMKVQPPQGWGGISDRAAMLTECPHGKPGDLLWVREAWGKGGGYGEECQTVCYKSDSTCYIGSEQYPVEDVIRGTFGSPESTITYSSPRDNKWNSPVAMPRWASRITLEITCVRVERLQDISVKDSRAEGVQELPLQKGKPGSWWRYEAFASKHYRTEIDAFRGLWTNINKSPENSWEANPWVWVIDFKKLEN